MAAAIAVATRGKSALKTRKTERANTPKLLPSAVVKEVDMLRALCTRMFGTKKPTLGDGEVQAQLHALFTVALSNGSGKLHSDLTRDNRRIAVCDELWGLLSKFL